jgi:hypothetical protein
MQDKGDEDNTGYRKEEGRIFSSEEWRINKKIAEKRIIQLRGEHDNSGHRREL